MNRLAMQMLMMPQAAGGDPEDERRRRDAEAAKRTVMPPQQQAPPSDQQPASQQAPIPSPMGQQQPPQPIQQEFGLATNPTFNPAAGVVGVGGAMSPMSPQMMGPMPQPTSNPNQSSLAQMLAPALPQAGQPGPSGAVVADQVKRFFNGDNVIQGTTNAQGGLSGMTINGSPFQGNPLAALQGAQYGQGLQGGIQETGIAGVPSAQYLSTNVLGRAGFGGSPGLDQDRMMMALEMQNQAANRLGAVEQARLGAQGHVDAAKATAEGKMQTDHDKAAQFGEAMAAQVLQRGGTPGEASNAMLSGMRSFAQAKQQMNALGITPPVQQKGGGLASAIGGAIGGVGGQLPMAPQGQQGPSIGSVNNADLLMRSLFPSQVDPTGKGGAMPGSYNPSGLDEITPNILSDKGALSEFTKNIMDKTPEQQNNYKKALAQQMATAFLRTAPDEALSKQNSTVDLEGGLLRLLRGGGNAMNNTGLLAGGTGYRTIQLPSQLGNDLIDLPDNPGFYTRATQSAVDRQKFQNQYSTSKALLQALIQAMGAQQK